MNQDIRLHPVTNRPVYYVRAIAEHSYCDYLIRDLLTDEELTIYWRSWQDAEKLTEMEILAWVAV